MRCVKRSHNVSNGVFKLFRLQVASESGHFEYMGWVSSVVTVIRKWIKTLDWCRKGHDLFHQ